MVQRTDNHTERLNMQSKSPNIYRLPLFNKINFEKKKEQNKSNEPKETQTIVI